MPLLAAAPLIGAAVGAAGGIGKTISEGEKANRDRQLASATQRYSPWTGLKAASVETPNAFGNIASGVAGGAGLAQNIAAAVPGTPAGDVEKNGIGNGDAWMQWAGPTKK